MTVTKVGVYVDVENLKRNGGYGMQYEVLRRFACRDGGEPVRLNAYVGFDKRRSDEDGQYKRRVFSFFSTIRDFGFKVIEKEVKWFQDEEGVQYAKANSDLDMAVDALLQSENLDRVLLATGDGDFIQVVRALQNKGCRVEVVAFNNVSAQLCREADLFISGFLIPNMLPVKSSRESSREVDWGEVGSRVRGSCYYYKQGEHFGFMRFLRRIGPLWIMDSRDEESPYCTAYFNDHMFKEEFDILSLPSRNHIFEFTLVESERHPGKLQAEDIELIQGG